jgi:uncharacterized protein (TIGR03118 family)
MGAVTRSLNFATSALVLAVSLLLLAGSSLGQHYTRTDLTADIAATSPTAPNLDPNLVNAWGLSRSSGSPFWVADNGTGLSTLYNGAGVRQALVVKIPTLDGTGTSAPTGTIFNYSTGFLVGGTGTAAIFLFCTEDGTIAAWNPNVDRNNAVLKVKRGGKAVYKGCALAQTSDGIFLYATNFMTGRVDIFDSTFAFVRSRNFDFNDDDDGHNNNGQGFAPFGIQNVGGNLVVTFAKKTPGSKDEQHGPGLGAVGIFDGNGRLLSRLQRGDFLNAPWGITMAPGDFGQFNHRLLIGNFGDGTVNAFNAVSGKFQGKLLAAGGTPLTVDGLWALSFGGNGAANGSATELYFTAGPNEERDGLFGKITAIAAEQRGNTE